MRLTTRKIERAKPIGKRSRLRDGMGLYLEIREGVRGISKTFIWRGTIGGKVTEISIGQFPWTTLEQARDAAIDYKRAIRRGDDPRATVQAERAETPSTLPTLAHCVRESFAIRAESAKNTRGIFARQKFLEQNAAPLLNRPVDRINSKDLVAILLPVWDRQSGRSMKHDLKGAFDWAIACGHLTTVNPAGDHLATLLPKNGLKREGRKAADYRDMPGILKAVRDCATETVYKLAWEFMALTASRANEAIGARWSEIDGDTWHIPAERMKGGREHSVPLCPQAIAVLDKARELGGSGFVFPSPTGKGAMSVFGLHKVRETVGIRETMSNHGARTCFRSWAADQTDFAPDTIELCLAHTVGNSVERAYNRGQMIEKRRDVHNAYCKFLTT